LFGLPYSEVRMTTSNKVDLSGVTFKRNMSNFTSKKIISNKSEPKYYGT